MPEYAINLTDEQIEAALLEAIATGDDLPIDRLYLLGWDYVGEQS